MKRMLTTVMLCATIVSLAGSTAMATLSVQWIDGDKVVYDATNRTYWYPLLNNMIQMTKNQQLCFIGQELNAKAYGNIADWHFATLEQVTKMCLSMAEGATPVGMGPVGTESFFPVDPLAFFEATNYYPPTPSAPVVFAGRTTNETAPRENVDGVISESWAEGEYHVRYTPETQVIVFGYNVHWVADILLTAPLPLEFPAPMDTEFECSAWVVSQMGPITCELAASEPPTWEPPACEPPVWELPTWDPPVWQPPVWDPPVVEPPTIEPCDWPFGEIDTDFWSTPDVSGVLFGD